MEAGHIRSQDASEIALLKEFSRRVTRSLGGSHLSVKPLSPVRKWRVYARIARSREYDPAEHKQAIRLDTDAHT
jgi:hypothetical protein